MYNLIIYEDNEDLRDSIVSLLTSSEQFTVAGAHGNCIHAADHIRALQPDIILMDIDMPGMTGIEAVRRIRQFDQHTAILMLTVFDDTTRVFEALKAGASGYLLKQHIAEKLMSSIQEMMAGGAPMSPAIALMVIQSMRALPATSSAYNLTVREQEILGLLSKGNSYKLIAAELNISLDTVRSHIKHVYEKLKVHSQTEAVSKAINEKLV